jgi:hypothetical protein
MFENLKKKVAAGGFEPFTMGRMPAT